MDDSAVAYWWGDTAANALSIPSGGTVSVTAYLYAYLPGTVMPDGIIRRMEAARDPRQEGISICAELLQQAKDTSGIAGAHLMAPGLHDEIVEAVKLAGLIR